MLGLGAPSRSTPNLGLSTCNDDSIGIPKDDSHKGLATSAPATILAIFNSASPSLSLDSASEDSDSRRIDPKVIEEKDQDNVSQSLHRHFRVRMRWHWLWVHSQPQIHQMTVIRRCYPGRFHRVLVLGILPLVLGVCLLRRPIGVPGVLWEFVILGVLVMRLDTDRDEGTEDRN